MNQITNITIMGNCLIMPVQSELNEETLNKIREDILAAVQKREVHGVIFDMSTVRILDRFEFKYFIDIAKMTLLLGAQSVFIGLRPGVVSSLVNTDVELNQVRTFLNLESGLRYFTCNSLNNKVAIDADNIENEDLSNIEEANGELE